MLGTRYRGPMTIDRDSPEPVYQQLARLMRARIESSEWPTRYRLPSEPALAGSFQVNRDTLRKAIKILVDEGRLAVVHGKGTYVA